MNQFLVSKEFLFIKELFYYFFDHKMEYLIKIYNAYAFPVAYFHKTRTLNGI